MLLRYADHLASGHGIVWNLGEHPVDGATDFLFMVLVASLHRAGLSLEAAAVDLGLAAHALTVLLVFFAARHLYGARPQWALVPAVFVAVGPGLRHLAARYATPLFTLAAASAWVLACLLAEADARRLRRLSFGFALATLILGLSRPEGVFLGVFMLLAIAVSRRGDGLGTILRYFLGVFATLGLGYFLWRWHYFGYPLPNPFYKKGGGLLYWHSLRLSVRNFWRAGLPFLLLLPLGLAVRGARRAALFVTIPVALFVAIWVLISDETNYVMRFQYPIVPVLLIGCVPVAQALLARARTLAPRPLNWRSTTGWSMALAITALLAWTEHRQYRWVAPQRMGLYDAALVLRDYAGRGLTLATTEAGLLPLYSTWRTVDAWGLNDSWIAHAGGLRESYLERYHPEVIMMHAYFSPGVPDHGRALERRALGPRWYAMVMTLKDYAESHGYVLAACFGRNAYDTHYYYVRRGFPRSDEIVARLRGIRYYWDGQPTIDLSADTRGPGALPTTPHSPSTP